jgi:hypothetical protein
MIYVFLCEGWVGAELFGAERTKGDSQAQTQEEVRPPGTWDHSWDHTVYNLLDTENLVLFSVIFLPFSVDWYLQMYVLCCLNFIFMFIIYWCYIGNWPLIKKTQYNFNTIQDEFKFLQYNTIQFLEKTNFNNSIQYEPLCIVFQYNSPCIGQPW